MLLFHRHVVGDGAVAACDGKQVALQPVLRASGMEDSCGGDRTRAARELLYSVMAEQHWLPQTNLRHLDFRPCSLKTRAALRVPGELQVWG